MNRRNFSKPRSRRQLICQHVRGGEALEQRHLFAGVWTPLVRSAPTGIAETMMLLSDGNVMVHTGFGASKTWAKLSPDTQGSYANGTYTNLAPMSVGRLYFPSTVLPSGEVFVLGGEFSDLGTYTNHAEIFNPVTNTWRTAAAFPEPTFGDTPTSLLPNGKILAGAPFTDNSYLYDPQADTWEFAAEKLRADVSVEETWVQLPGGNVLSYDLFTNGLTAQFYDMATNTWQDTGPVPIDLRTGTEIGAALQMADGRIFQVGGNNQTAIYDPLSNSWQAGPTMPVGIGSDDAPAVALPNGHILFVADRPSFSAPSFIFDYDPTNNRLVDVTPGDLRGPTMTNVQAFITRMLVLPNSHALLSTSSGTIWDYAPDGVPDDTVRPRVESVTSLGSGVYSISGSRLNGYSEGAAYGDDAQMATNYPIVQLTNSAGRVFYGRSFDWQPGLTTDNSLVTTSFSLPAGLAIDDYELRVIASGISSAPVNFSLRAATSIQWASPGNSATIETPVSEFRVRFNGQIDPQSLSGPDLLVNGLTADAVVWNEESQLAIFTFTNSPISQQGLQSLQILDGSISGLDGSATSGYSMNFRYDADTLQALSFSLADGVELPPGIEQDMVVTFSEQVQASSISPGNLTVSRGQVLAAELLPGGLAARYRFKTSNNENSFFVSVNANSFRDQFGNPAMLGYAANYAIDKGLRTQLPSLVAGIIPGSGVYSVTMDGNLRSGTDVDGFRVQLTKGQVLSAHVHTDIRSGLQLGVKAISPNGQILRTSLADLDGDDIHLAAIRAEVDGEYRLEVYSINNAPGDYQIKPMINADVETEFYFLGRPNNVPDQAQNLDPAFIQIGASRNQSSQASVMGLDFNKTITSVSFASFDFGNDGFTVNNSSAYVDRGLWHITTRRGEEVGHSPTNSFYYGNEATGNFETAGPNAGTITSAPIKLPPHGLLDLRFNYVLQTENLLDLDEAAIDITTDGGLTYTRLASTAVPGQLPQSDVWREAIYNLTAYAGKTIQLRFSFDTKDAIENQYEGWYVDDVAIWNDDDWNDYYSFTVEAGQQIDALVRSSSGTPLKVDIENTAGQVLQAGANVSFNSSQAKGYFAPASGTYIARVHGEVESTYELFVTLSASLETPANTILSNATPLKSSITTVGYAAADRTMTLNLEAGLQDVVINNEIAGTGDSAGLWHLSTRRGTQPGHSGATSFYYGSETTGTYNTGARNAGSFTTGEFSVPIDSPTLTFNYVLQTQGITTVDRASVLVSTDNFVTSQTILVGGTTSMPFSANWRTANFNLSGFAGRNVKLRFLFDTVNALNNNFEGWYVDDITISNNQKPEWHSIAIEPDKNAISVQLRTPWAQGEIGNQLKAKLELFDSSGVTLVATGAVDASGTVTLNKAGLVGGSTYRLKLTAIDESRGEYELDILTLRDPVITSRVDDTYGKVRQPDGWFEVSRDDDKGWRTINDSHAYQGDYTIHSRRANSGGGNYAEWSILATSATPELFVSWIALPGNATNATYEIYRDSERLGRVVLDQTRAPNDALIDGVLAESLGSFSIRQWKPGTRLNVRLITHDANGDVVADGLFDPPTNSVPTNAPLIEHGPVTPRQSIDQAVGSVWSSDEWPRTRLRQHSAYQTFPAYVDRVWENWHHDVDEEHVEIDDLLRQMTLLDT